MTDTSGETPRRTIRVDDVLWSAFTKVAAYQNKNATVLLRDYMERAVNEFTEPPTFYCAACLSDFPVTERAYSGRLSQETRGALCVHCADGGNDDHF